jgi:uncharacterized Zn finger protein
MTLPPISETILKRNSTAKSFSLGEQYLDLGAVTDIIQRNQQLQADIEGSEPTPYRVTIYFNKSNITEAGCTCPYNQEGWCKHIVATLLTTIRNPGSITNRPSLEQLLDQLDHLNTQRLIKALVAENPTLIDSIDLHVTLLIASKSKPDKTTKARRSTLDAAPFSRQVRQIIRDAIRSAEDGYEYDAIAEDLAKIIAQAQEFIAQGDSGSAIVILEAITSTCVNEWDDMTDYGLDSLTVVDLLNDAWAEAILSNDLEPEQFTQIQAQLEEWQDTLGNFELSLLALQQGWDYPPLQRVLQGDITESIWAEEAPDCAEFLSAIRLRILDRQSRHQEYLYLAQTESYITEYLLKLIELEQIETAIQAAEELISRDSEAFEFAKALQANQRLSEALAIAKLGLSYSEDPSYQYFELASWTSDLAENLGDSKTAIAARITAFKQKLSFQDYRKIEALSGKAWSKLKPDLLETLRQHKEWGTETPKVDIFLHEGLIEDAIETVRSLGSYYNLDLLHRVMESAISTHPTWVIEEGCRRAEPTMDHGKSAYYSAAVEWLQKVRLAYLQLNQPQAWGDYRESLVSQHGRKRKLMELFQKLPK